MSRRRRTDDSPMAACKEVVAFVVGILACAIVAIGCISGVIWAAFTAGMVMGQNAVTALSEWADR